ncbi:MAG: 2-dehydropantoate 2-reductase [Oscillospiraceae bacterium]|nr:2-dehydropantoate 2-reductase [Oscillospiraceae bacterium]
MKIAMIGSGAAGSVFACYLKKGGAEMTLVDRYQRHMDACRESGLRFVTPEGEELLTGFQTASSAAQLDVQDLVILMVKATQTEGLIPDLRHCVGPETVVVSLQNGLGNDELLSRYFPPENILYGFGTIGTELPEPGKCVSKPESGVIMRFGAVKDSPLSRRAGQWLEQCFNAGGCSTVFEPDIRPFVWKKAISNSGYNTLSALLRLKVGDYLALEAGEELLKSVWAEGCAVCKAVTGVDLWPEMLEELPRLKQGFATYYPSMAQDVLIHQRQTEVQLLNGAIVRYGEACGIPTPINEALTRMITCIQASYEKQYQK